MAQTDEFVGRIVCVHCKSCEPMVTSSGYRYGYPAVGCCLARSISMVAETFKIMKTPDVTSDVTGVARAENQQIITEYTKAIKWHLSQAADPRAAWAEAVALLDKFEAHRIAAVRSLVGPLEAVNGR